MTLPFFPIIIVLVKGLRIQLAGKTVQGKR